MERNKFILSPCGTSLLTNADRVNAEERNRIFKYANIKNKHDIPNDDREQLQSLIHGIDSTLETADIKNAVKMSAEINGIVKIYQGVISKNNDVHFLLSTDTWLGEQTTRLVEKWLKLQNKNFTIIVHRHTDLQTYDIAAFQLSLSELVRKFSQEIPGYSKSGYKIIFNLTGGFKSVQGFLQSIANFYADETVYIFETSSELMRIPRLPIRMDAESVLEKHVTALRNLAMDIAVPGIANIPEIFLITMDGQTIFSPWGDLVWLNSKSQIYGKALLPSPRPGKIAYGDKFKKDVKSLPSDRVEIVNNRIDQLNRHLDQKGYNPDSLDFKQLKGNAMKPSTHEMDAWTDLDARRIFGHFEKEVFVLDRLAQGLH